MTNIAEKPHFDRIMRIEGEIAERKEDLKALWQSAKDALDKENLAVLKRAVKLALEDDDKKTARHEIEQRAETLLAALGPFVDSPLGVAAVRAAQ